METIKITVTGYLTSKLHRAHDHSRPKLRG
jgi:hypothetical protein